MQIRLVAALVLAVGVGCAGFNKAGRQAAGMGVVTDSKSSFSGTRWIRLSPAPVGGTTGMFSGCCSVGMSWTPQIPEGAILIADVSGIVALDSVSLNLDGDIRKLEPADRFTQFGSDHNSQKGYYVPWPMVERIQTSKEAKILITTLSRGSVVGDFRATDGAMFIDFLPEFVMAVRKAKAQ
jgi:hypothetical protein